MIKENPQPLKRARRRLTPTRTVKVGKKTWERTKKLFKTEDAKIFDEVVGKPIDQSLRVPGSIFGVHRPRMVQLTLPITKKLSRDSHLIKIQMEYP